MDSIFEKYVARCTEIKLEEWKKRGFVQRVKEKVFYALNEVL